MKREWQEASTGLSNWTSLGGTSNLNFMVYIRGHPLDYDYWAYLTGDDRWNYTNFLQYFKKSEDFRGETPEGIGNKK